MRPTISCAILGLLAGAAGAAELKIRDIRFSIGVTPESDEIEIESRLNDGSTGDHAFAEGGGGELEMGPRGTVGFYESFGSLGAKGGFILGLTFSYAEQETKGAAHSAAALGIDWPGPVKTKVSVFDLHFGWGYAFAKNLHVEIMPFVGYGSVQVEDTILHLGTTVREDHTRNDGPYWEGGVRFGLYYAFANGGLLGVDAGYIVAHGRAGIGYIDGTSTYEWDQAGPVGNLNLGFRF